MLPRGSFEFMLGMGRKPFDFGDVGDLTIFPLSLVVIVYVIFDVVVLLPGESR